VNLDQLIEQVSSFIKKHSFWAELALYVAFAGGTAMWIGKDAYRQAAALTAQGQTLDATRKSADQWLGTFRPATSAEAQEWQQAEVALQQLGATRDSRLTLVEVITRRAERAGLTSVKTVIAPPDSAGAIPRPAAAPVTFTVADYSIIVDVRGSLPATRAFLANLPAAVSVQRLSIGRIGSTMGTRAVLTVYEAVANAPI
jgi:hypothetical protein